MTFKALRGQPGANRGFRTRLNDAEMVVTSLAIPISSGGNYVQRGASPLSISSPSAPAARSGANTRSSRQAVVEKRWRNVRVRMYVRTYVRHVHRQTRFLRFRFPARERLRCDWLSLTDPTKQPRPGRERITGRYRSPDIEARLSLDRRDAETLSPDN